MKITISNKANIVVTGKGSTSFYSRAEEAPAPTSPPGPTSPIEGTYRVLKIDKFDTRVSSSAGRQEMLNVITTHGFNWIQFYSLNTVFASTALVASMSLFISQSRAAVPGIKVGGIRSANPTRFQKMLDYNLAHPWYQQFDDFNIEYEFWNLQSTDPTAWSTWSGSAVWLRDTLSNSTYDRGRPYTASGGNLWTVSAYVQGGNQPAGSQRWYQPYVTASDLVKMLDVYEATNYNSNAPNWATLYNNGGHPQLDYLASASYLLGTTMSFVPIFSLEMVAYGAANDFSGNYFKLNGLAYGEAAWSGGFNAATASAAFPHTANLKQIGFNYFDFEYVSASLGY